MGTEPGTRRARADGRVTRLTGLDLDVTERRRAEEALQARRDEEHDRELQLLLETATQGIVSVDAQARSSRRIARSRRCSAGRRGELIGQSIERLLPPSVRDASRAASDGVSCRPAAASDGRQPRALRSTPRRHDVSDRSEPESRRAAAAGDAPSRS